MKKIILITGGIACGKSTCLSYFESRGYKTISLDDIYNNELKNKDSEVWKIIHFRYGDFILDSEYHINKEKLKEILVLDNTEFITINKSISNAVLLKAKEMIEQEESKNGLFFLEYPTIKKEEDTQALKNLGIDIFKIININLNKYDQVERLTNRNPDDWFLQEKLKANPSNYLDFADYNIFNNKSLEMLYQKLDKILKEL